jgi:hypothetical protein
MISKFDFNCCATVFFRLAAISALYIAFCKNLTRSMRTGARISDKAWTLAVCIAVLLPCLKILAFYIDCKN